MWAQDTAALLRWWQNLGTEEEEVFLLTRGNMRHYSQASKLAMSYRCQNIRQMDREMLHDKSCLGARVWEPILWLRFSSPCNFKEKPLTALGKAYTRGSKKDVTTESEGKSLNPLIGFCLFSKRD